MSNRRDTAVVAKREAQVAVVDPPSRKAERHFKPESASRMIRPLTDLFANLTNREKFLVAVICKASLSTVRDAIQDGGLYDGDMWDDLDADCTVGVESRLDDLTDAERQAWEVVSVMDNLTK